MGGCAFVSWLLCPICVHYGVKVYQFDPIPKWFSDPQVATPNIKLNQSQKIIDAAS